MSPFIKSQVIRIEDIPVEGLLDADLGGLQSKPVVMVVDDEPLVTDTLTAILQMSGYRTLKAYDAETALRIAAVVEPAVLVSDVAMPGMNGIELALAVSRISPECHVLLFSGHATRADLADAHAEGFDFPLLSKPVAPDEMLRQIAACLRDAPTPPRAARPLMQPSRSAMSPELA